MAKIARTQQVSMAGRASKPATNVAKPTRSSHLPERFNSQSEPQSAPIVSEALGSLSKPSNAPAIATIPTSTNITMVVTF
jgi:hypothetical protein